MSQIEAKPISGFKEFLPEEQLVLERFKRVFAKHYERFGFTPLEVAAVERTQVLLAKAGENTKQIYGVHLLERSDQEHGDNETGLALHFDLTVPLARYVAQNYGKLDFPFRRYQMQKVWRGERPQKGRFREFYQCDIDVIGDGQLSLLNDAEMPAVIHGIFSELQIGKFLIRINNRKISEGLLQALEIPLLYTGGTIDDKKHELVFDEKQRHTFSLLDPLEKCGTDLVRQAFLHFTHITAAQCDRLMEVILHRESNPLAMIAWLRTIGTHPVYEEGIAELQEVLQGMHGFGVPFSDVLVDVGVTRGLDYYTGTVYETVLVHHESIGSVCSGGRFENLASHYIDRKLPGVGISIGLTRLLWSLFDKGIIKPVRKCPTEAIIFHLSPSLRDQYFALAMTLRQQGISTEMYLEDRKVDKQTKYAVRKHIPYGIFMDEARHAQGVCTVRSFVNGHQEDVTLNELATYLGQPSSLLPA